MLLTSPHSRELRHNVATVWTLQPHPHIVAACRAVRAFMHHLVPGLGPLTQRGSRAAAKQMLGVRHLMRPCASRTGGLACHLSG